MSRIILGKKIDRSGQFAVDMPSPIAWDPGSAGIGWRVAWQRVTYQGPHPARIIGFGAWFGPSNNATTSVGGPTGEGGWLGVYTNDAVNNRPGAYINGPYYDIWLSVLQPAVGVGGRGYEELPLPSQIESPPPLILPGDIVYLTVWVQNNGGRTPYFSTPGSWSSAGADVELPIWAILEENRPPNISAMSPANGVYVGTITPNLSFRTTDPDRTEGYKDYPTSAILRMFEKVAGSYRFMASQVATLTDPGVGTSPVDTTVAWTKDWDPSFIMSDIRLNAWIAADKITGLADGTALPASISDVTGKITFGQGDVNLKPIYRTNQINSKAALDFENTGPASGSTLDYLDISGLSSVDPYEDLFVVIKPESLDADAWHSIVGTYVTGGRVLYLLPDGTLRGEVQSVGTAVYRSDTIGALVAGTTYIIHLQFRPTFAAIRVNGSFYASLPHALSLAASGGSHIGYEFDGLIAEVISGSNLPDADCRLIEGYLAHKYGLTASLPTGHAYKTTSPKLPLGGKVSHGLWTPEYLPPGTRIAHFDASKITGVTSGTGLAAWLDLSGNALNADQSTAGAQPTYLTAQINGLAAVDFDNTNDYLYSSVSSSSFGSGIFAIIRRDSSASADVLLGSTGSGARNIFLSGANPWTVSVTKEGGASLGASTVTGTNGTVRLVEAILESSFIRVGVDGVKDTVTHAQTLTAGQATYIGTNTGLVNPFDGQMAEIVMVNTATLSMEDEQRIEGYLAWKWGIQANLPSDHPYRNIAPKIMIGDDDGRIYAWTAEVRDVAGGKEGTGYGGRNMDTEGPDGTTEFNLKNIGLVS